MRDLILGLGGNIGDVKTNFEHAIHQIEESFYASTIKSSTFKTKAWGNTEQPDFLNMVIVLKTDLALTTVFSIISQIEKVSGRDRKNQEKWGPRSIDLDILFFGDVVIFSKELVVPHPQIQNRNFVLIPLNEIMPNFVHPQFKKSVKELIKDCNDTLEVIKI